MTQLSVPRFISVATFQGLSSPTDGDLVTVQADAVNGINWILRYNASSASVYKWETLGGPSMISILTASATNAGIADNTWYDLTSSTGPSITLPLSGDYNIILNANLAAGAGGAVSKAAVKFGATTTSAADGGGVQIGTGLSGANYRDVNVSRIMRRTNLTTGTVLKLQYFVTNNANTTFWSERSLSIIPIRVSTT